MKKGFSFFCIISALLCFSLLGCKLKVEEEKEELVQKPDIDISNKQVTLIIPKINSSTNYINIYRKDSAGKDEIIGLIFPKDLSSNDSTYRFIDELVYENEKYQYKTRYKDSEGFHYSDWSNEIKIEGIDDDFSSSDHLTYKVESGTKLKFSATDYTLKVDGTITAPSAISDFASAYTPSLIIKASDKTQVFEVSTDFLEGTEEISLRGLLPSDFMDRDIQILGLLAQKKVFDNPNETDEKKKRIKFIRWTSLESIKVQGKADNILNIPSQSGAAGFDYTRSVK